MAEFPARIHVLFASHAPLGLVIRRGPSKQVATILWKRSRDRFELGQWFKGRIDPRRCDLSPDGKHFLSFALNGKWASEAMGSWTAISRAPYLKALTLFPQGDTWDGGGLWTNKNDYWLHGHGAYTLRDTKEVRRNTRFDPTVQADGKHLGIYSTRLLRDGWQLIRGGEKSNRHTRDIFEKELNHGWCLRKIAHAQCNSPAGKGIYWDEHQLVHAESDTEIDCPDWEWAERDNRRVVWASGGKLFAGRIKPKGLVHETELFDFNPMRFEAIEAPY